MSIDLQKKMAKLYDFDLCSYKSKNHSFHATRYLKTRSRIHIWLYRYEQTPKWKKTISLYSQYGYNIILTLIYNVHSRMFYAPEVVGTIMAIFADDTAIL